MYVANNWDNLFYGKVGSKHEVIPAETKAVAEIIETKARVTDFYGDFVQGEDDVYVIFKVGDRFFKKTGTMGSYDDEISWSGPVVEVFAEAKTVYEFRSKR